MLHEDDTYGYFLFHKEKKEYISLDHASGGYPCFSPDFRDAYSFISVDEAKRYRHIVTLETDKWIIIRVKIQLTEVTS